MKFLIFLSVMVAKGLASTHFVKQPMPTTRSLSYCTAVENKPIISIPYCTKGHGDVIGLSCSSDCRGMLLKRQHLSHALTQDWVSFCIIGQQYSARMITTYPFMYFSHHIICFVQSQIPQVWKSETPFVQYVSYQDETGCLNLHLSFTDMIIQKSSLFQARDDRDHPIIPWWNRLHFYLVHGWCILQESLSSSIMPSTKIALAKWLTSTFSSLGTYMNLMSESRPMCCFTRFKYFLMRFPFASQSPLTCLVITWES